MSASFGVAACFSGPALVPRTTFYPCRLRADDQSPSVRPLDELCKPFRKNAPSNVRSQEESQADKYGRFHHPIVDCFPLLLPSRTPGSDLQLCAFGDDSPFEKAPQFD